MQATKQFLLDFPAFFGAAVAEIREEEREEGREAERKRHEAERKRHEEGIFNLHQTMGLTVLQIANTMGLAVEYVQSIIDKNAR